MFTVQWRCTIQFMFVVNKFVKKKYVKTIFVIEIWNITVRDFNILLIYKILMDSNNENCEATNNSRDDDPWGENDPWDQTFIPRFNMLSPR